MKKSFRFYTGAGLRKLDGALVDGKVAVVSVENEFKIDRATDYTDVVESDGVIWDSDAGIVGDGRQIRNVSISSAWSAGSGCPIAFGRSAAVET